MKFNIGVCNYDSKKVTKFVILNAPMSWFFKITETLSETLRIVLTRFNAKRTLINLAD